MKDEILYGLKNAIQRGSTLERAMQSFINAGYNETEVRETGKMLSSGVTDIISGEIPEISSASEGLPPLPVKKKKRKGLVIAIILIILIILGLGGYLTYSLIK